MAGPISAITHLRVKIDPDGELKHPNIKPLCNQKSLELLGIEALGYMTEKPECVTCLACRILMEHQMDWCQPERE